MSAVAAADASVHRQGVRPLLWRTLAWFTLAAAIALSVPADAPGKYTAGNQVFDIKVPFDFFVAQWKTQGFPMCGPTIQFNVSFGIANRGGFHNSPASVAFPLVSMGRSVLDSNTATALTSIIPLLEGDTLVSNGYSTLYTHPQLVTSGVRVTAASGETWIAPPGAGPGQPFIQPISLVSRSAHAAFEVELSQCGTPAPVHCCAYFDDASNNTLKVFNTVLYDNSACAELNYAGDLYGFVFPSVTFEMEMRQHSA